jgi:BlaI family transcriptional regulator, penicillinase repressor
MHPKLSRRERDILNALFTLGERASAEEIRTRLPNPPGYSAVRAMLSRLESKGLVRHREERLRYVYSPTIPRVAAQRAALQEVVRVFFGGSPGEAAAALLASENWSDAELAALSAEVDRIRRERERTP